MPTIDIADYDQSDYDYTGYWPSRQYEDQAERLALKELLPHRPKQSLIDLGGGFGRLSDLYANRFAQCTLFDYSQVNLKKAGVLLEKAGINNVKTVKGSLYEIPFPSQSFEVGLMVRVMHHLKNPSLVLKEVNRILRENGLFVLEFPNKIHFKARVWEGVKGNFGFVNNQALVQRSTQGGIFYNFHPQYIQDLLHNSGFTIQRKTSVSNLRSPFLKKMIPLKTLLFFEKELQAISKASLNHFYIGPSIFLLCKKINASS